MTSPLRHPPSRRPKRGALGAEARLSRLLVMLPWLMERKEVPLDEVAATFSMSRDEVVRELELASMCGLPPFVDELIDVFIDEETVFVGVPRLFTKPLRLTAPEGFALLTAGRAAMQLPGADPDSPLGRGLTKLAAVLGEDPDSDPAFVVDLAATDLVDEFVAATKRVERMKIRYWTASRDEVSERDVTPRRVFDERGDWYVSADDHRSGERRTFRIDRIESYEADRGLRRSARRRRDRRRDRDELRVVVGRRVVAAGDPAAAAGGAVGDRAVPVRLGRRATARCGGRHVRGDQRAMAGAAAAASGNRRRGGLRPPVRGLAVDAATRVLARYT